MTVNFVWRHPKPLKGRTVVGFAPLSGQPRDAAGRLILDRLYAPSSARPDRFLIDDPWPVSEQEQRDAAALITRGVRAIPKQDKLI